MICVIDDFKTLLMVRHGKEQGQELFHKASELCKTSIYSMSDIIAFYRRTNEIPTKDEAENIVRYNLPLFK